MGTRTSLLPKMKASSKDPSRQALLSLYLYFCKINSFSPIIVLWKVMLLIPLGRWNKSSALEPYFKYHDNLKCQFWNFQNLNSLCALKPSFQVKPIPAITITCMLSSYYKECLTKNTHSSGSWKPRLQRQQIEIIIDQISVQWKCRISLPYNI